MPYGRTDYSFVVDSSFQPFSMQEMLVPLQLYKSAYDSTEAAYDELNQKAGDMKYFADNLPEGSKAKAVYDNYAQELDKLSKDFSKHGLNINNRRGLTDLKRRYAGEIGMLEKANALRLSQMKEQHDLTLKDPTLMFSREARFSNLDDYLANPDLSYQSYSGALLAKQVNDAAASIAKSLVDYTNGKPLDGNTRTWLQQHGLTALEVAQAISNPHSMQSSRVLSTLMNSVIESSNITAWADPETLKRAYLYASQGLWKAIGENRVGTYKLPAGGQGGKVVDKDGNVVIPPLVPTGGQQRQSGDSSNNRGNNGNRGSSRNRRYTYATGGYLLGDGGSKVKISPQLGYMLDNMNDSTYNAFITEQIGKPDYTEAQEDSVLQAYDKLLIESMENNYLRQLENEGYTDMDNVQPLYKPRNVLTTREYAQTAEDAEMLKKYGHYFTKRNNQGSWMLTPEGMKAYKDNMSKGSYFAAPNNSQLNYPVAPITMMPVRSPGLFTFRDWIDKRHLSEMAKGRTGKYQSGIVDNMMQRASNKYDATLATEYTGLLDSDQKADLVGHLYDTFNNGELPKFERVKEGGTYIFKDTGSKISLDDVDKDMKSASVNFGKHGNYLAVTLKGGDRVYIPFGLINSIYDPIVTGNVMKAEALRGLQEAGSKVGTKDKGKAVETIEQAKTRALNAALYNMISTFSTWKPKSGEVVRGIYRSKND